jgi:acyl-CoA reductase-like NAD-dependent aldehyde dehydrogenase
VELPDAHRRLGFAPALAAGNTVVLKPAELTPLTAIRLGELALEAGLPRGRVQVLPGKGSVVGQRFVDAPAVARSSSPGRPRSASRSWRLREQVKRVTLELGGKSGQHRLRRRRPGEGARPGAVRRVRQRRPGLLARVRILVERSAYDRFLELLEPAVKNFGSATR